MSKCTLIAQNTSVDIRWPAACGLRNSALNVLCPELYYVTGYKDRKINTPQNWTGAWTLRTAVKFLSTSQPKIYKTSKQNVYQRIQRAGRKPKNTWVDNLIELLWPRFYWRSMRAQWISKCSFEPDVKKIHGNCSHCKVAIQGNMYTGSLTYSIIK